MQFVAIRALLTGEARHKRFVLLWMSCFFRPKLTLALLHRCMYIRCLSHKSSLLHTIIISGLQITSSTMCSHVCVHFALQPYKQ